jgi:hypothetical protein
VLLWPGAVIITLGHFWVRSLLPKYTPDELAQIDREVAELLDKVAP